MKHMRHHVHARVVPFYEWAACQTTSQMRGVATSFALPSLRTFRFYSFRTNSLKTGSEETLTSNRVLNGFIWNQFYRSFGHFRKGTFYGRSRTWHDTVSLLCLQGALD